MDLLIEDSAENIDRLLAVLSAYGEGFSAKLTRADFDDSEGAIRIVEETEQCQIDLFTRMSGRRYADVLKVADTLTLRGHAIRYASKASLIGWKEASVREKDRLDAPAAEGSACVRVAVHNTALSASLEASLPSRRSHLHAHLQRGEASLH